MTVEATIAPGAGEESRLRTRALDTLRTATLDTILQSEEPLRTVDIARSVAGQLGLRLNDEELGGLASVVRMVLDSDPLFSQSNRQWDLALRMGRAEGDRRKPVERAVIDFIDLIGHPADVEAAAVFAAAVYGRHPEYYEAMITRVAPKSELFFPVDGQWGISRWLLEITSDDAEDVEFDNFSDKTVLNALRDAAKGVKADDALAYAQAVVQKAGDPVDNKALQFLTWSAFPDTDPAELFASLYETDGLVLERGPAWVTAESHREVLNDIRSLASNPEVATEALAATLPAEEEETSTGGGLLAPTTVRVSDDDLEQVLDLMEQEPRTFRVSELCQQALEAFPGSRTYQGVHDSLLSRMHEDDRFLWVGYERFRLVGSLPADVQTLPEGLAFDTREYLDDEENEVDKYVDPRDWKGNLDEQVLHYLVQDVADDNSPVPSVPPAELPSSPPLHHYVAGTRFLRNSDRGFFAMEPALVNVTLALDDGTRMDVWVNNNLGLLFGLKEWYEANLPWVGGLFHIRPTEQPDEFRLEYSGETEPLLDITARLPELLQLRVEAVNSGLPLLTIVERILRGHPDGVHFVTLFGEINVVRRIRREQLASALSSNRAFQLIPGQPFMWHFDEKRAAKAGRKKGPKRPMREYDDDDEEIIIED